MNLRLSFFAGSACAMKTGSSSVAFIVARQSLSTSLKRRASVDSWRMMSSEPKMGSRYIQTRWHAIHSSMSACAYLSWLSQALASSSMALMNMDPHMVWVLTKWSSSKAMISSMPPTMDVPRLLVRLHVELHQTPLVLHALKTNKSSRCTGAGRP